MLGFLTDGIENALDVGESLMTGEDVSKRQVARLIDDGLSAVAIASMFGVSVDYIKSLAGDS